MPPKFSAYLDVVRFTAALTVFIGHAAGRFWTGGFLWPVGYYADTCVVIFFVLSGYVIAYVCENKERSWQSFTVNRVARLWSVVLPALLLTLLIDFVGVRIAPELYLGQKWYAGDMPAVRYLASLLMLQEVWHVSLVPGINAPFWSLTYEAIYYLVFGLAFFASTPWKWLAIAGAGLLGGPVVVALFPVWLLGYFAFRVTTRMQRGSPYHWLLFAVGAAVLAMSPVVRGSSMFHFTILGEVIVERYIDAVAFTMNLVGAYGLCLKWPALSPRLAQRIAGVAGATFVLYLFHRPLIQMFSYLGPADPASALRRLLVIGGTLAVVYVATPFTERLRVWLRVKGSALLSRGPLTPAARIP